MGIVYATREDVKRALDSAETARTDAQVDRALDGATDAIHGLCHRRFYPELRTMTFDWPNPQSPTPWRLWLDANELISITTLVAGGVTIPNPDALLRPDDGPPFTRLEVDTSSASSFAAGGTTQRAISITGLFGYRNDEAPAGALAAAIASTTQTTVDVTDSSTVGVGSLLRADSERMIVTGKTMLTTGQTLQAPGLDAKNNTVTVPVAAGTGFAVGEVILVDAERMLVVDIAGNNLIVKRAWDGSVLAAHTAGATVFAPRRCTVDRGVLGTTAATHGTVALVKHQPPPAVRNLAIAEALATLGQEQGGYSQQLRPLEGGRRTVVSIQDIRDQVYAAFGRKTRMRAVMR